MNQGLLFCLGVYLSLCRPFFEFDTDVTIEVFDMKGIVVTKFEDQNYKNNVDTTLEVDLSNRFDAVLFVKVTTNKGSIVKKIISNGKK